MSNKLLEACEEFVRKVDCGEARSKRSYKQMKEAITEYYHAEALSKNNSIKKQLEDRNIKCINITFAPEVYGNGSIDKDKLTIEVCDIMQSYLDGKFTKVDFIDEELTEDDSKIRILSSNPVFLKKLKDKMTEKFMSELSFDSYRTNTEDLNSKYNGAVVHKPSGIKKIHG